MKKLVITLIILLAFLNFNFKDVLAKNDKIKFSVFLYDEKDTYINLVKSELKKIEKNNSDKIEINFYDANNNSMKQIEELENVLKEGTDIVLMNLVDTSISKDVINTVKYYNIPIIVFNREPVDLNSIKSYGKSVFIGSDSQVLGELQGKIIKEAIESGRIKSFNNNEYIDYIMIMGDPRNNESEIRTESVINYLKRNNIKIKEIERQYGYFNRDKSRDLMNGLLIRYIDNIDLVIANNDEMAIGAIESLQEMGYNKGDSKKYIPVVGIDGIEEAKNLINSGIMEGSVIQDPKEMAEALIEIGSNLEEGNNALKNTAYEFDNSGVAVRIKGLEYIIRK